MTNQHPIMGYRSKAEAIIAFMLKEEGIKFEYEPTLEGFKGIPDFKIGNVIWEHLGFQEEAYLKNIERKKRWYLSQGFQYVESYDWDFESSVKEVLKRLKTQLIDSVSTIEGNIPKVVEEPIVGQKKREYVKKEMSFRDLVKLSPRIICKPAKGVMFPSKLLYNGRKLRPLAFIKLVCALNDIPVFTKTDDKFKVEKGENLLSAMVRGMDLNDTYVYMDGIHVPILTIISYTVEDIHQLLKQNSPKSLENMGLSKTFSTGKTLVKMKNLPLFTDGEKKQFIVFSFEYLRDASSSVELLSNTIEKNYDVYGATMNPTTKVFIISRYFVDCDLTSKEVSIIKHSL